jgi:enoyl-CoA hydratase/carnithine racemase
MCQIRYTINFASGNIAAHDPLFEYAAETGDVMAYQFATYEKKDRIGIVTINRPERMNALHPPANFELHEIWNEFKRDPDVWVGILTGAGDKAFSAGNDLRYTAEHGRDMVRSAESGFGGLAGRTTCWKPILAAVNGFALGGGFEMALACDIIIAADHARLGLPEPKVGLMAGAGGVHRLPRMIPQKIAMGYILTGRHMTAQEAHRLGVVNEVVPLADLMPTVMKWANEILECAPLSIRASKQASLMGLGHPLDLALRMSYTEAERMRRSEDTVEGPRAFAEKRKPRWQAR